MRYRVSWCYRKFIRFFIYIEAHSKYFYRFAYSAEHLLFKKYNLDPLAFESRYTVFDFTFFVNRLVEEIHEENKAKEKTDSDELIKLLRLVKYKLNKYDL